MTVTTTPKSTGRNAPIDIDPGEFRQLGHDLVDRIAELLETLPGRRVTAGLTPAEVRALIGDESLPEEGGWPATLVQDASRPLAEHSRFTGHPRLWGGITSSHGPPRRPGESHAG